MNLISDLRDWSNELKKRYPDRTIDDPDANAIRDASWTLTPYYEKYETGYEKMIMSCLMKNLDSLRENVCARRAVEGEGLYAVLSALDRLFLSVDARKGIDILEVDDLFTRLREIGGTTSAPLGFRQGAFWDERYGCFNYGGNR